ncbi:hypothetical protein P8452_60668 [Trifolium repens]|nr:hypothetical protein P8452_54948 [Trifolium repens]WJX77348.1 hypothetical protein P8452_60668 [Trifolium repens]
MFLKPKLQTYMSQTQMLLESIATLQTQIDFSSSTLNRFTPQTDHLQASDLRFLSSNLRSQIATLHTHLKSLIYFNFPISRGFFITTGAYEDKLALFFVSMIGSDIVGN